MRCCEVQSTALPVLAASCGSNPLTTLLKIYLLKFLVTHVLHSDNYIGGMGAVVLANALKANSGLRELHIKGNELGDSGTTALCEALKGSHLTICFQLWLQAPPCCDICLPFSMLPGKEVGRDVV